MDPKNADRLGKGFLVALAAGLGVVAKKYGPQAFKMLMKIILRK